MRQLCALGICLLLVASTLQSRDQAHASRLGPHGVGSPSAGGVPAVITNTTPDLSGDGSYTSNQAGNYSIGRQSMPMGDGDIIQTGTCPGSGCMFYWYGFRWQGGNYSNGSTWGCPTSSVNCYAVFSSPDLVKWTDQGNLGGITWNGGGPEAVYNATDNDYVIWGGYLGVANKAGVLVCSTPTSGCTTQPNATVGQNPGGQGVATLAIFVDDDGTGYVIYASGFDLGIYIQQLNAHYTDTVGSAVLITDGNQYEEPSFYKDETSGRYFVFYGPPCTDCQTGVDTYYQWTTTPLSGWSTKAQIGPTNSCGGQPESTLPLTVSGTRYALYQIIRWPPIQSGFGPGSAYQEPASRAFELMTFSAGVPSFSCDATTTVPGLTTTLPSPVSADITTENDWGQFKHFNDPYWALTTSVWAQQSFVATHSGSTQTITLTLGKNDMWCSQQSSGCGPGSPDQIGGDLVVNLLNFSGSVLATQSIPSAQISYAMSLWTLTMSAAVTMGQTYYIQLQSTSSHPGYFYTYVDDSSAYPAGNFQYTLNGGSSWTPVIGRSLKFSVSTTP